MAKMTTACENNERVRKALQWALEELRYKPEAAEAMKRRAVYDAACLRFDLTPLECEHLFRLFFAQP